MVRNIQRLEQKRNVNIERRARAGRRAGPGLSIHTNNNDSRKDGRKENTI